MLKERLTGSRQRNAHFLRLSPFIRTMAVKPLLVRLELIVSLTDETLTVVTHWRSAQQGKVVGLIP